MTKFMLINWQAFACEMIELDKINFLTGLNGSGKSSVIDAMQLVLLADTAGNYFNKAANEKGDRTLAGYLRGELGDNDEQGGFRCLRTGRFTSYVCAQFLDTREKKVLTAGCCFDHYSENDIQHQFFLFDGAIPEEKFVGIDKTPWDRQQLRRWMESQYPQETRRKTTPNGKEFRGVLYARLGGIPPKFADLLKRAVPFKAINDIEDFITEFVCTDEKTVEVLPMLDNINSYRELEQEAKNLEERVGKLTQISERFAKYRSYREQEQLYRYLVDRAELEIAMRDCDWNRERVAQKQEEITLRNNAYADWKTKESILTEERNSKQTDYMNDQASRTIERLENSIREKEAKVGDITKRFELSVTGLKRATDDWKKKIHSLCEKESEASEIDEVPGQELAILCESAKNLEQSYLALFGDYSAEMFQGGEVEAFRQLAATAQELTNRAYSLGAKLTAEQQSVSMQLAKLREEQIHLQKGVFTFPDNVTRLRQLIQDDLWESHGLGAQVPLFAELLEVRDKRWQNAIEGYLNTQRFNIIVEPKHYARALRLYNEQGRQNRLYGVGLVNIAKVQEKPMTVLPGSLAEEIDAKGNPMAQAYVNYLMGRVMKCSDISELEHHQIAITQNCMLYKNYVSHLLDPKVYTPNVIGKEAIKQRLEAVAGEIRQLTEQTHRLEWQKQRTTQFSLTVLSITDIDTLFETAGNYRDRPHLEQQIAECRRQRDAVDRSHLEVLKASIDALEVSIKECNDRALEEGKTASKLSVEIDNHQKNIEVLNQSIRSCNNKIVAAYDPAWVEETGGVKYEYESGIKSKPEEIKNNFSRALAGAITQKDSEWVTLRDSRISYMGAYKVGFDPDAQDNDAFDKLLDELNMVQLPDYLARIEDTRKKAYIRFQDDFISRLRENIKNVEAQIEDINDAIRINFSQDVYRFRVRPNKDSQRFYRMFMDDMLLVGGFSLFSAQFNEKYKTELDELFGLITAPGGDFDQRIKTYTDYKTYLTFDMEVSDAEGNTQRLSKTLNKKSGGETQNPFYITILASFAQMYRLGRDKEEKTIRLIIFDEAFSKMDGERIASSISLLRKFDFQVILSAPPDKASEISTLVDQNLVVLKKGRSAFVRSFKPHQIGEGVID